MGLAEKRAVKEFADQSWPQFKAAIIAAAGFEPAIEVNWDQLAAPEYGHLYKEAFPKVYFEPVVAAFKSICSDEMGRDALKAALKKIEFVNTESFSNSNGFTFEGGTLRYDHKPCSNIDYVEDRTKGLVKLLESKL